VGYTWCHLHDTMMVTNRNHLPFFKHFVNEYNAATATCLLEYFHLLAIYHTKLDYPIKDMFFISKLKPSLNLQIVSVCAKVFV